MKKRHILIVDDDVLNSSALERRLQSEGFRVTVVENCAQCKAVLRGKAPVDLMILDHSLPDGTSDYLLESMTGKGGLQKPPVIMSSSLIERGDVSGEAMLKPLSPVSQALIQAFVPKPYSLDNMHTVVDLVFEATPAPFPDPKTILSGDYRHPKRRTS